MRLRLHECMCVHALTRTHSGIAAYIPPGQESIGPIAVDPVAPSIFRKNPAWEFEKGGARMAANVKALENMEKHMTKEEIRARQEAEAGVVPDRKANLKPPKTIVHDAPAKKYWKSILERMEGLDILDDLDAEMLAVYCSSLSRRDVLNALCHTLMDDMKEVEPKDRLELTNKLDSLISKLQANEKILLSFADKLGMTPEARARLARKRAAAEAEKDPDADLFGD